MPNKKRRNGGRRTRGEAQHRNTARASGPRPVRAKRPSLKDLNPPGTHYTQWCEPGPRARQLGLDGMLDYIAQHSKAAEDPAIVQQMMRVVDAYAELYGGSLPDAAFTLDLTLRASPLLGEIMSLQGVGQEGALRSFHELHATGLLLVDDEGTLWMSVPPGCPDASQTQWHLERELLPAGPHPA